MTRSSGFPPVERGDARTLILGSLPGRRSIEAGEYYAHPQNAFWPIMDALFGISGDYARRCDLLTANRIALWDVLESSVRPGSMDSDILLASAQANDFEAFLESHVDLRLVAFNGAKAEQLFARFVRPALAETGLRCVRLPSTSPAYAAMPFSGKLAAWRAALC